MKQLPKERLNKKAGDAGNKDLRVLVYLALSNESHPEPEAKDRSLYDNLIRGIHRETRFLEFLTGVYAKKKPKPGLMRAVLIGLYQGLFLDQIPEYANYSTIKNLLQYFGYSDSEQKFVHVILKKALDEKAKWLELRKNILSLCAQGGGALLSPYQSDEICAALNLSSEQLSLLRDAGRKIGLSTNHVWKALAALKGQASLLGRAKLGTKPSSGKPLTGALCEGVLLFSEASEFRQELESGLIFAQGECSQWLCAQASKELQAMLSASNQGQTPLHGSFKVLEVGAGKGGKTIGTLQELKKIGAPLEAISWVAVDTSPVQEAAFSSFAAGYLHSLGAAPTYLVLAENRSIEIYDELQPGTFDMLWIDAPCSGLGTLSKHPEVALRTETKTIEAMAETQNELILKWQPFLKKGGLLIYSVCTMSWQETGAVVEAITKNIPSLEVHRTHHMWPGLNADESTPDHILTPASAEGFFVAMWKKSL
jgi:hypothetical protein